MSLLFADVLYIAFFYYYYFVSTTPIKLKVLKATFLVVPTTDLLN